MVIPSQMYQIRDISGFNIQIVQETLDLLFSLLLILRCFGPKLKAKLKKIIIINYLCCLSMKQNIKLKTRGLKDEEKIHNFFNIYQTSKSKEDSALIISNNIFLDENLNVLDFSSDEDEN